MCLAQRSLTCAILLCLVSSLCLAQVTFTDVTEASFSDGLPASYLLWSDCNRDGWEDLLVGGKSIYINGGPPDFVFTKATDTGDLAAGPHSMAQWIDIDNDGDPDLFGIGGANNDRLYLNDGNCHFTDISDMDGNGTPDLGDGRNSTTVSVGDYDADGFLDILVGNYERHCEADTVCGDCEPDVLWHNLGDNTFANVYGTLGMEAVERERAAGVPGWEGICMKAGSECHDDSDCAPYPADSCKSGMCARSSQWVDYNNDGHLDIYLGNYRLNPNFLWENDGAGGFTEVAQERNADGNEEEGSIYGHTLGVDWGDYDNDGDMDIYIANLCHALNVLAGDDHDHSELRENDGGSSYHFEDVRPSSGMYQWVPDLSFKDWAEFTPAWADYDLDGDLDIYVTHGYVTQDISHSRLNSNNGDRTFTETTSDHGANLKLYRSYAAAWCDYDRDGDLDLATYGAVDLEGAPTIGWLFRNDGANSNAWLQVALIGQGAGGSNHFGVGGRVTVSEEGIQQTHEVQGGHGYHTERNSVVQTFGFGANGTQTIDELTIRWSTGLSDSWSDRPTDLRYTAYEGVDITRGTSPQSMPKIASALFPFHDPVRGDGQTYFYRIEGSDGQLNVTKDAANDYIVLDFQQP